MGAVKRLKLTESPAIVGIKTPFWSKLGTQGETQIVPSLKFVPKMEAMEPGATGWDVMFAALTMPPGLMMGTFCAGKDATRSRNAIGKVRHGKSIRGPPTIALLLPRGPERHVELGVHIIVGSQQ